jgi:hypothetical protein
MRDASAFVRPAPPQQIDGDASSSLASLSALSADSGAAPRPAASVAVAVVAGEAASVAAGRFMAGSTPGDDGRDPKLEPVNFEVNLGAYEIDRLPYPNDPAAAPRTDVTLKEAEHLCGARGQRLCSEVEWEAACRGSAGDVYATGEAWDPACGQPGARCAAKTGVLGLGSMREWTASRVLSGDNTASLKAAVRGSSASEPTEHRCAHRAPVAAVSQARDLGFRCCRGPANDITLPAPKLGQAVRKLALEPAQLAEILAGIPQLASVQPPIKYFADPEDVTTVLHRGQRPDGVADPEGFTLTTSPLLWSPVPGDELLVAVGHGQRDSFIVALYRLPDNHYKLASSLLLVNDLGPFVLAYHPEVRERLLWSSCWKCAGEGGAVSLRDGRRVVIVQQ